MAPQIAHAVIEAEDIDCIVKLPPSRGNCAAQLAQTTLQSHVLLDDDVAARTKPPFGLAKPTFEGRKKPATLTLVSRVTCRLTVPTVCISPP
jgi:hypothetical protein